MTTPAGWYPDPSDASQQRWWDGNAWTEHQQHVPGYGAPTLAQHGYGVGPAFDKPRTWLWLSIISVFGVTILGVIAIVFSTQVNRHWQAGRVQQAASASKTALWLAIIAIVIGIPTDIWYVSQNV
jgi:hypothetical protein